MPCEKKPVGRIATMTTLQCLAILIIMFVFYQTYLIAVPRYRSRRYSTPAAHLKLTSALPLILQVCCLLECSTRLALLWAIRREAAANSRDEWNGARRYLYFITAIWETCIVVSLYYTKLEKLRLSFNDCAFRMSEGDLNKMNRVFFGTMCLLIVVGGLNLSQLADEPAGAWILGIVGAGCLLCFFVMFGVLTHAFRVRMTILVVINEQNSMINADGTIGMVSGKDESARAVETANKAFNAGEMVSEFVHTIGHIHYTQKQSSHNSTQMSSKRPGVGSASPDGPKRLPPRKDTVDRALDSHRRVSGQSSSSETQTPDFGAIASAATGRRSKNVVTASPSSMSSSGFNEDRALNEAGMLNLSHEESTEIASSGSMSTSVKRKHERTSTAVAAATAASLPADPEVLTPGLDRKLTISSFNEYNRLYLETAAKQCVLCTMDNITMTLAAIAVVCWLTYSCMTAQVMFGHFCMTAAVLMAALSGFYSENCPQALYESHCGVCDQKWRVFAVATAKMSQAEVQKRLAQQRESYTQQRQSSRLGQ